MTMLYLRRTLTLCLLLLLTVGADAMAQSRVGTTAGTFLTLGAGARGSALGHAYTAQATGADALFWNPGGAARAYDGRHRGSVFLTHHEWLADINYNAAGLTIPITASGVLGISVTLVDYGRVDVTTEDLPEGTGETFSASDLAFGLTYAQPLTESFYIGGTVKLVRQDIWDMHASTAAFDLGFVLETQYLNGMRLAASIQNFGGKLQMEGVNARVFVDPDEARSGNNENIPARYKTDGWDLPLSFRLGVALPAVQRGNFELLALADAQQTNDNDLNSDLGARARYRIGSVNLAARAGYKDLMLSEGQVDSHWSFGAGMDLEVSGLRVGFDFAYIPFDVLNSTQLFDLRFYY
ncbi:MAG: PorV/PorQ family protein [Bacteroidetes bacterium]|jgi:hypothetical protein|nr:PorV/PorQ family protein [Bacteroidota bacterium]